ncbi:MAG TPA: O-antigen ligase family protein [Terriglobales bacterium]
MATSTTISKPQQADRLKSMSGGFFWLSAFYLVYCARPEDFVHVLALVPMAKITGIGAFLAFLFMGGQRKLRDLPREAHYLLALIAVLMLASLTSPIWRGGSVSRTLEFSKVYIAWALTFFLVTDIPKLRRIIFIQAFSVPIICAFAVIKGRSIARLDGVLGGIYSNPNDLAFAIVLSFPFCFMFLLTAKGIRKLFWVVGMLAMAYALVLTASRGGFVTLLVTGVVGLWHFGIKGRRYYLIAITGLVALILLGVAGGPLRTRFATIFTDEADSKQERAALASYEDRKYLMERAIDGIEHYPILGMGTRNFEVYSLNWHEVHMTYLEIAVEGGIVGLFFYLAFFARGFHNLRVLLKRKDLSVEIKLITGALHSSLVGFVVGALFSPEAYEFFPYFSVAYTSALYAIVKRNDLLAAPPSPARIARQSPRERESLEQVPVGR